MRNRYGSRQGLAALAALAGALSLAPGDAARAQTAPGDGEQEIFVEPGIPLSEVGDHNPRVGEATPLDIQEMPVTDLLNRLSAQGYARYSSIRRVGDIYRVEAVTTDLRPVTLEVDATTGEIRSLEQGG